LPVQNLIKLNEKYVAEIHSLNPDKIWVYPSHLTGIISQFEMYDIVVTGPDCSALNFYRKMGDINYAGDRNIYNTYRKHLKFEQYYTNKSNIMLHLVGMDDLKFLKQLYPSINAFYMQHPHYSYLKKTSYFTSKKMTVLIAGQYNHYVKTDFDRLFRLLLNDNTLVSEMSLTFIGKGWTRFSNELHNQGYETSEIIWVEEYFSKLIEYDIQVFPISLGVGTKGKVLDALCCGLICIGSKYAFENIAVQHGVSCIQYDFVDNIPNILKTIKENKEYYIQLAKKGQSSVLKHHSPEMIANMFYRKIHEK
jgi:glycosyltransferase involved in cell wall biosynthesis